MVEVVTEAALEAAEWYPNERLIVHYLQPHAPYIGPTGVNEFPTEYLNFWRSFRDGEFDVSLSSGWIGSHIKAYRKINRATGGLSPGVDSWESISTENLTST
jgi:hypothetical protein